MFDPALIAKCADPDLKPAIVRRFVAEVGVNDPLMVTVRIRGRMILVPQAKTREKAMVTISRYVGNAVVRVGITQYPAGIGIKDSSDLNPSIVDACDNIRIGTTLFAKVYRRVVKWYGSQVPEAFDDAIAAWSTGYFEGKQVFQPLDPGVALKSITDPDPQQINDAALDEVVPKHTSGKQDESDPERSELRIDLSKTNEQDDMSELN